MTTVFEKVCQDQGWECTGDTAVVALPGGRSQMVVKESLSEEGEEYMRLFSPIGEAATLDEQRLRSALSLNYRMRHGALAVREDQLIITETFLLRDADDDEVRLSIEYLARTADTHERHIYGTDNF